MVISQLTLMDLLSRLHPLRVPSSEVLCSRLWHLQSPVPTDVVDAIFGCLFHHRLEGHAMAWPKLWTLCCSTWGETPWRRRDADGSETCEIFADLLFSRCFWIAGKGLGDGWPRYVYVQFRMCMLDRTLVSIYIKIKYRCTYSSVYIYI